MRRDNKRQAAGFKLQDLFQILELAACSLRLVACSAQLAACRRALLFAVCGLALLSTGCLRRSLTIRTDPPGALVYVNDQIKGTSPVTYDFLWYGWHRVTIRKEGFVRVEDRTELRAPPHLWIPFDLVVELLPWTVRDDREWSYTLEPLQTLPTPIPPSLDSARDDPERAERVEGPKPFRSSPQE